MSVKKEYLNSNANCRVRFSLPQDMLTSVKKASVVGDFNEWDPETAIMKKRSNGTYSVTVELPVGKEYQFRYLLDGNAWMNEEEADKQVQSPFSDSLNSVLSV